MIFPLPAATPKEAPSATADTSGHDILPFFDPVVDIEPAANLTLPEISNAMAVPKIKSLPETQALSDNASNPEITVGTSCLPTCEIASKSKAFIDSPFAKA